ncbi:MAG TPA: EthD family reductase [Gaiellaceae bacterium]
MIKIVGYWTAPADPADIPLFEDDYMNRHVPIAAKLPGLRRLTTLRVEEGYMGGEVQHYRIVEAWFDDTDALEAALLTAESKAMREDRQRLIDTYGVMNSAEIGEEIEAELRGAAAVDAF